MRRLAALVFLIALSLPYARTPLCELGSHGHEQHGEMDHRGGSPALADAADGGVDCHVVMGCRAGADLVIGPVAPAAALAPGLRGGPAGAGQGQPEMLVSPELPPPRTI